MSLEGLPADIPPESQASVGGTLSAGGAAPMGSPLTVRDPLLRRCRTWRSRLSPWTAPLVEILILLAWTLLVTRPYLNLDPTMIPAGSEYLSEIQGHNVWVTARQCGLCALWDGSSIGGHPAFADLHGSVLHPLVVLSTLGWGLIDGSKLALVGAFLMAGIAQWWLAWELRVGSVARLYSAAIAVVAGSLAGRMNQGVFAVVMSTSACALVMAAAVAFGRRSTLRAVVALGAAIALAAVAGQGYLQVGLAFLAPAALILVPWGQPESGRVLGRLALAGGLGLMLAGVFLIPFAHFLPQFGKDLDPNFASAQFFKYVPLNLVINDLDVYLRQTLHTIPYPYLYTTFVGWVPVLLAVYGLGGNHAAWRRRVVVFLGVVIVLSFWIASAGPLRWLVRVSPFQMLTDFVAGLRNPSLIAGLAVPCVLGLAALGLDRLLHCRWPSLKLVGSGSEHDPGSVDLDLRWLLAIPLLFSLLTARAFAGSQIRSVKSDSSVASVIAALKTPDLQWVNTPFGEHFFISPAIASGLKLAVGWQPWQWKGRPVPEPVLQADRQGNPPEMVPVGEVGGVPIYEAPPGREYAVVGHPDGSRTVCTAAGVGGNIDIACDTPTDGILVVKENSWSGWRGDLDGRQTDLNFDRWLSVDFPAGSHSVRFRYRPWDVLLGMALSLSGVVLACILWFTLERNPTGTTGDRIGAATVLQAEDQ
jgi:hypothetical protein